MATSSLTDRKQTKKDKMKETNTTDKPRTLEEIHGTTEEIQRRQHELKTKLEAELAALEIEKERAGLIRAPFAQLTRKRDEIIARMDRAKRGRVKAVAMHKEYESMLDSSLFELDHEHLEPHSIGAINTMRPDLAAAEQLIPHIDRWLKTKQAELDAINKQREDYAKANGLEYLLKQ